MNEQLLINKYIRPIVSKNKEALNLQDDVAIIDNSHIVDNLVVTTDDMLENKHFFSNESPESIAYRLMISNLSDLATKGATPKWFTLNFCPKSIQNLKEEWVESFFNTIESLQSMFNIKLIGGNIASTGSTNMFSATVIGSLAKNSKTPYRFNAKNNNNIYISNYAGDAFLGYCIIAYSYGMISKPNWLSILTDKEKSYLTSKYYYPNISIQLGISLNCIVNACTDASDGIVNSIMQICKASGVCCIVNINNSIFSQIGQKIISFLKLKKQHLGLVKQMINWGGDYNLVFAAPNKYLKKLNQITKEYNNKSLPIICIGKLQNDIEKCNTFNYEENKLDIDNSFLIENHE